MSNITTIAGEPPKFNVRPISSRPVSARAARPDSAGAKNQNRNNAITPIKHEPCSSTLAKFHEGVNYSLLLESHHKPPTPRHPILEAKEKYKYMSRQKSFVDESLFGPPTSARLRENYYSPNHLTHDYMSNQTALAFNSPIRSNRVDSARSVVNQNDMLPPSGQTNRPNSSRTNQKPYVKPWR